MLFFALFPTAKLNYIIKWIKSELMRGKKRNVFTFSYNMAIWGVEASYTYKWTYNKPLSHGNVKVGKSNCFLFDFVNGLFL